MTRSSATVLLASPLTEDLIEVVRDVDRDRLSVAAPRDLFPDEWDPAWPGWSDGSPPWTPKQRQRWQQLLGTAEVVYDTNWIPSPERLRVDAPRLRWIQATVSGVGAWVAQAALREGTITVTTAGGIHATPLAEFVVLGLLYFRKRVERLQADRLGRRWRRDATPELAGSTAMVIGLGHVGRRVAAVLHGLGVNVWAVRHARRNARHVDRVLIKDEMRDLLPHVDAVILCAPLTPATRHIVGAAELEAMAPHAVLVNVSRGDLVDEVELIAALRDGHILGAALDVFSREPLPSESPLWLLPNVLMSPHNAGVSSAEPERAIHLFADNLRRYLAGRRLRNRYLHARGY